MRIALTKFQFIGKMHIEAISYYSFAGKSRSTSFVLAYLMMDKGLSLKDAVELTRSKRTIAEPNPGFMIQLKAFEKVIFGTLSDIGIVVSKKATQKDIVEPGKENETSESSVSKEIADGIEMLKISGDEEGAKEIEKQISQMKSGDQ